MNAVVLGRIGYDLYSEEPHVPLARAERFRRYLGGSSANMAVGLSRLGLSTGIVSCLGDDALSDFLREYLRQERVDVARVQTAPGHTPSLCLTEIAPPDRFPQVFYRREAADIQLSVTAADLEYLERGAMFITNGTSLCASPSRESTYRALEHAKAKGLRVVFDADYRAMSWASAAEAGLAIRLALPFIDVLIANDLELALLGGVEVGRRVPLLVAKLGSEGARVFQGADEIYVPPYAVDVVSTIGAGDGFASGFLFALSQGLPLEDCLRHGNAAAAIVVSRLSCADAMPRLDELRRFLEERSHVR
jgi:5-dehydro-2-deoxygluconokinase